MSDKNIWEECGLSKEDYDGLTPEKKGELAQEFLKTRQIEAQANAEKIKHKEWAAVFAFPLIAGALSLGLAAMMWTVTASADELPLPPSKPVIQQTLKM